MKGWGFRSNRVLKLNWNHMEVSVRVHPTEAELEIILKVKYEIISCVTYRVSKAILTMLESEYC